MFTSSSKVLLLAPHPDDESLACSVVLQRAVRAGAVVRVLYATDGDNNPWPQRVMERRWRLTVTDRRRWGRSRRTEALAALRVLGLDSSVASFLALPDQELTALLRSDCQSILRRLAGIIADFDPTHLLTPSISDTHPDHSALAVMVRLVLSEFFSDEAVPSVLAYAVHGRSIAFLRRAWSVPQSDVETEIKRQAIQCHRTQIRLSRRRFFAYADRPERFMKLSVREGTWADGSIRSVSRQARSLRVALRLPLKPGAAEPQFSVLGYDEEGLLRCATMRLPAHSCHVEMSDCATGACFGIARYRGNAFSAELAVPIALFSPHRAIFVKLQRRSWFFDEAGWLELPAVATPRPALERKNSFAEPAAV